MDSNEMRAILRVFYGAAGVFVGAVALAIFVAQVTHKGG